VKFRVEVDRIVGRVVYEAEVDPANGRDEAIAAVLSRLRSDPGQAAREFDAASYTADGARLIEYEIHMVVPVAPTRLANDPHHRALDATSPPSRKEL
jgi:hypothetical protein